jgi:carboxyl-terminal processing protease
VYVSTDRHSEVERKIKYVKLRQSRLFVFAVGVSFGAVGMMTIPMATKQFIPASHGVLDATSLQNTYTVLREKYDGKLDEEKLIEGANRGLVEAAGDRYTAYFNAREAKQFDSDLSGTFEGIGAELDKKDQQLIVVAPLEDSPAKRAGIKAGDVIVAVDDEETFGWTIEKAVSKIRGKGGTTVKLSIVRDDQAPQDVRIVRATIDSPSVKSRIEDSVGIMTITRFGDDTTTLARQAALDFQKNGVKRVVLDVRGNGGGYLQSAQDVASLWLKKDAVIVEERRGSQVIEQLRATGDAPLEGVKTVVLIDKGSASASEIVAGALHDNKAATLVGEKSFGKGSVQTLVDLPDNAKLKVTIAKWYTPKGKNITKHGIAPDVSIAYGASTQDDDTQLNKALELVRQ